MSKKVKRRAPSIRKQKVFKDKNLPPAIVEEVDTLRSQMSDQQRAFVDAYLSNGFNGRRAAIDAGYSEACAYQQSSRLLKYADIRRVVDLHAESATITAKQVIARLSELATVNVSDFVTENGSIVPGCVDRLGHLIKGIKAPTMTRGVELELHDSMDALDKLAKIHRLYAENTVQVNAVGPVEFVLKVDPQDIP